MKNHKVLSLLPRFAAFLFGVVLALSIFLPRAWMARAEADESQCPPPPNCAFFTCYKPLAGASECKFIALENGAQCHVGGECSPPEGD